MCHLAKIDMNWMSLDPNTNRCVAQLIDANLDRAREGLRVVEDWCRFALDKKELVITLKDWRQQLGRHHKDVYKQSRSTERDQGIGLSHPEQENRHSPKQIISANCSRAQEALRVLEEFSRINDPALAKCASEIRYQLYELELEIIKASLHNQRKQKLEKCKAYLITNPHPNLLKIVEQSIKAGISIVQYRNKIDNDLDKLSQAKEMAYLCKRNNALFIINDRIDLAIAVDADGIHLGQNDMPYLIARKILGDEKIIGRSTHCLEELLCAQKEGCDYVGAGPIYHTNTKSIKSPTGIKYVKEATKFSKLPYFAIGGINSSNIHEVISAGAARIAVSGAIMNAKDPTLATIELLNKVS